MALVLGVDPGFSGALAWYNTVTLRLVAVVPMPITTNSSVFTTETRPQVDGVGLARLLRESHPTIAVVEQVNASPKMGVVSAFRFGEGFGVLQGVLDTLGVKTVHAFPSAWKSALGLSRDKRESVQMACNLWPEFNNTFSRGKASGDLAEAALLAYYGRKLVPPDQRVKVIVPLKP